MTGLWERSTANCFGDACFGEAWIRRGEPNGEIDSGLVVGSLLGPIERRENMRRTDFVGPDMIGTAKAEPRRRFAPSMPSTKNFFS